MENKNLKIAFVSKDGKHITGAFGSAKFFEVVTISNGEIINKELREPYKYDAGVDINAVQRKKNTEDGTMKFNLNVYDPSKAKHIKMAKAISDCNYVVARGMCANAWDSIEQFNMKPIITKIKHFDEGVRQIIDGTIINYTDKINQE